MTPTLPIETFGARHSGRRRLVFLHGAFVTHAMGRHALPLAQIKQHPCVSVGLPGHPGAPAGAWPERTAASLADLLAATLDDGGVGPDAAVVGHSLGGLAALCLAVHRPERLAAVACVSGTAGGLFRSGEDDTALQRIARASAANPTLFRLGVRAGSCSAGLHRWLAGFSAGDAAALRRSQRFHAAAEAYLPALWRADTESMRLALRGLAELDVRAAIPQLAVPALFLHGDADPVFPAAPVGAAARACPAATFRALAGIGHLPMFEAPAACGAALAAWLGSLPPGRP